MFFNPRFMKTDVTVIKLFQNFILVGVGGDLHVFESNSHKLIKKVNIFEGETIHGVVPNDEKNILLFGGHFIKLFDVDLQCFGILEKKYKVVSDWILDARWINKNANIAAISLHNKFYLWNLNLEVQKQVNCEENCILYSAYICFNTYEDLVVLSGTVFSEILIWKPFKNLDNSSVVLKRLTGHKGVIFSIHYNDSCGFICSTSDDCSGILWSVRNKDLLLECTKPTPEITRHCQVFGHLSRVFRCKVLTYCFITAGEDSILNIWSHDGKLLRKLEAHQGDCLWALDCDENRNIIVTGGGNGGVTIFPINHECSEENLLLEHKMPKMVAIMSSGNLAVVADCGNIFYYSKYKRQWKCIQEHTDLKRYVLMKISCCRKLVALAGFEGQIYIYREYRDQLLKFSYCQSKFKSRILNFHWLTCDSFIICQAEGRIELFCIKQTHIYPICHFILPLSKKRCTTTAILYKNKILVGDQRGNIYLFKIGRQQVIQTVKKAHNHLGVTKLKIDNDKIISLGRNGLINTFSINDQLHLISTDKLPLPWLTDISDNLLIGFSSKNFVIWDYKTKRTLWEKDCGGGHRSWNFLKVGNNVTLTYIKNKCICIVDFDLNSVSSIDLVQGYHSKEINALKLIKYFDEYVLISGGEDTRLRISVTKNDCSFFETIINLKSHLSSIRAITVHQIYKDTYLIVSAGGRAQIVCWKLEIINKNSEIKYICSEQHSYYKVIDSSESEIRIMDLSVTEIFNKLVLFCACSDGNIQIFIVEFQASVLHLTLFKNLFYKLKCILKLDVIDILRNKVLITMATDGNVMFWNVSNIFSDNDIEPFFHIHNHQSGINSCHYRLLSNDSIIIITGGDDNAVVLNYLRFMTNKGEISAKVTDTLIDKSIHCAQVTGTFINDKYFITASIDQRIVVFLYKIGNEKIISKLLGKYKTTIADIQGLECLSSSSIKAFIFGKGLECLNIDNKENIF